MSGSNCLNCGLPWGDPYPSSHRPNGDCYLWGYDGTGKKFTPSDNLELLEWKLKQKEKSNV